MTKTTDRLVLPEAAFRALAGGDLDRGAGGPLVDTDGRLVDDGPAHTPYEAIMRAYRSKRSMTMVTRTDAQGSSTEGYLWMGPEGVLSASVAVDASEVTLRLEPGASRFRALIDMVGLGPRPAPMRGFEPAQIRQDLLVALVDHDAEPGTPGRARAELSDAVHEIAPGVAQCLGNGEATVVGFASEWVGTDGEATAATTFIDTPEGYLLHSSERRLLRQKHFVEPAPTWLVWASVVRRVPSRVDVESWLESARS